MRAALIFCAAVCLTSAFPFTENFVQEEGDGATSITRECFQRACTHFGGHTECRMGRIPCQSGTTWLMAEPERLVEASALASHGGLVDVVEHKKPLDPNAAISMPGIPAKASASLQAAMKEQDMLLTKIINMEKTEEKMDPLHKQARLKWLKLAKSVQHMAPSPAKLKNEHLLLMLAKNLAKKEMIEHEEMKKVAAEKKAIDKASVSVKKKHTTVTYSRCFEKACLNKNKNGFCGAAVVSCEQVPVKGSTGATEDAKPRAVKQARQAKVVKKSMAKVAKQALERAALAKVLPLLKKLATEQQEKHKESSHIVPEVAEMELPEEELPMQQEIGEPFYQQQNVLYQQMLQKP